MKSSNLMMTALVTLAGAAGGCSNSESLGLAPLDQPAVVTANGAQPQSQITLYHQGAVDPAAALTVVRVDNAFVRVSSDTSQAHVEDLIFLLADTDLAPTTSMPNGLKLRHQRLQIVNDVPATVTQHEMNALTAHAHGSMTYRADTVDDDGTVRSIGPVVTDAADFDVRATRYESGVHVTVDAAPQGSCWKIPGVLEVSNCSLYVELDGDAHAQ